LQILILIQTKRTNRRIFENKFINVRIQERKNERGIGESNKEWTSENIQTAFQTIKFFSIM
jgi:hypothetical protein